MDAVVFCVSCGSPDTYFSRKTQQRVCEDCGGTFALTPPDKPRQLFFSYGHDENTELILRIKDDVEALGYRVWLDKSSTRAGDDWRYAITEGIVNSDTVVSFLSRHSVRKPGACLDELRIALCVRDGLIKPVLLEPEAAVDPPSSLSHLQWLDMSEWRSVRDRGPREFEDWYASKLAELVAVVSHPETAVFAGQITFLRARLAPHLSDSKESELLSRQFVGRRWLNDDLEAWRNDPDAPSTMLILAGPGIGKSAFVARQLHYNPAATAGVFCEWHSKHLSDPSAVLRTLAFKLACKLPDYRATLIELIQSLGPEELAARDPHDLFDLLFAMPLSAVVDGGRQRVLVFLDGLDELGTNGHNLLGDVLARYLSRLPRWIRLIVTSRPERAVVQAFSDLSPTVVAAGDSRNRDDIYRFLASELTDELLPLPDKRPLLDRLADATEGSFLYATLLVESARNSGTGLEVLAQEPRGLDAYYTQLFERRFPDRTSYLPVRKILELIVAGRELPSLMLKRLLESPYAYAEFREALGPLVTERRAILAGGALAVLSFIHKSLPDWLADADRSGRFFVDAGSGGRTMTDWAVRLITTANPAASQPERALREYVEDHILGWFTDCSLWRELEAFLLLPGTPLDPYWTALASFPDHYDDTALVERLLGSEAQREFFGSLQHRGEGRTVRRLLDRVVRHAGLRGLDSFLINALVDAVHMEGDYREAVELCGGYLAGFPEPIADERPDLVRLQIRRLHHSMFVDPVEPLIAQAERLYERTGSQGNADNHHELLFLLGGNLGLLSGAFERARPWLERSLAFAEECGNADYLCRSRRKMADLLALDGDLDGSLALVEQARAPLTSESSRYDIYLVGSLAESLRARGRLAEALHAYDQVLRLSTQRAIRSWRAHAVLGQAAVMLDLGEAAEAVLLAGSALEQYDSIHHAWGRTAAGLVGLHAKTAASPATGEDLAASARVQAERASWLNHAYEADLLRRFAQDGTAAPFRLLFL